MFAAADGTGERAAVEGSNQRPGGVQYRRGLENGPGDFLCLIRRDGRSATVDKDVAASLLSLAKSLDDVIVKMFAEVEKIEDAQVKSRFKAAVGDLMGSVARDLIFLIENRYPDLRTDA